MPRYSSSRFEFLAGRGDRPEAANPVTLDDLVAVTLLSVDVPGDVAPQLLEQISAQTSAGTCSRSPRT